MILGTCDMCGVAANPEHRIKKGNICNDCYNKLPDCVKTNLGNFKVKQLKEIITICSSPHTGYWLKYQDIMVCFESIIFSGKEWKIQDIKSVDVHFYPVDTIEDQSDGKKTFLGYITLEIETLHPHLKLEDVFTAEKVKVYYTEVKGRRILQLPNKVINIMTVLESAILNPDHSTLENDIAIKWEEESRAESKRSWEQYEKETQRRSEEQQRHERERQYRNSQKRRDQEENEEHTHQEKELNDALKLYALTIPFTCEVLKKKRNTMLKHYHPDEGMYDTKYSQKINAAYDVLQKYANN